MPALYRIRAFAPDLPPPADYAAYISEIHANGWYTNFGPLARRLERGLIEAFGTAGETCVTCASATAGLSAALLATGRTGAVLLPAFTFPASFGGIRAAGLTPIVIDVDPQSWSIESDALERALAATGASIVMLVEPFGIQRSLDRALDVCRRRNVSFVIDNASGLGVRRAPRHLAVREFEVLSMHAIKPFAVGEGGVIFAHAANDASLRAALNFGLPTPGVARATCWGFNGNMSEFHAAVGLAQLDRTG